MDPNPASDKAVKFMQISITDVLFEDQVCNLVHMRDSTHIFEPTKRLESDDSKLKTLIDLISLIKEPVRLIKSKINDVVDEDSSLNKSVR